MSDIDLLYLNTSNPDQTQNVCHMGHSQEVLPFCKEKRLLLFNVFCMPVTFSMSDQTVLEFMG